MQLRFKQLIKNGYANCPFPAPSVMQRKQGEKNDQDVNWLKTLIKTNHTKQICDNQINYVGFNSIIKNNMSVCLCVSKATLLEHFYLPWNYILWLFHIDCNRENGNPSMHTAPPTDWMQDNIPQVACLALRYPRSHFGQFNVLNESNCTILEGERDRRL